MTAQPGPADAGRISHWARTQNIGLLLADVLGALAATLATAAVKELPLSGTGVAVTLLIVVVVGRVAGLYDKDGLVFRRSVVDETPRILQVAALAAGGLALPAGGSEPLLWLRGVADDAAARRVQPRPPG